MPPGVPEGRRARSDRARRAPGAAVAGAAQVAPRLLRPHHLREGVGGAVGGRRGGRGRRLGGVVGGGDGRPAALRGVGHFSPCKKKLN